MARDSLRVLCVEDDDDGFTVARAGKQRSPGTPVAMLTGYGRSVGEAEATSKGVDEVITEPIGARDLSARLIALTTRRVQP